jgi:UDP-N-acetylmuramate dehydrogenase
MPEADLASVVWFRVGGKAEVLYKPADAEDLCFFLKNRPQDIPVTVIGVGSNLLIRDGGVPGVVIKLGAGFNSLKRDGAEIITGAGVLDRNVALFAANEGLGGLEFLSGIPGTLGGGVRMNAGAYGREIKDILKWAEIVDFKGNIKKLNSGELGLQYRSSSFEGIVLSACLEGQEESPGVIHQKIVNIMQIREETQPVRARTGGSTFKNPEYSAWKLIDEAGCRGLQIGGAQVSEKHCNFIINTGNATAEEIESLGEEVRQKVKKTSGIELEWEIQRIGKK